MASAADEAEGGALTDSGLGESELEAWSAAEPSDPFEFGAATAAYGAFWERGSALLARLAPKPSRSAVEARAAALILTRGRASRERFLGAHAAALYDRLTDGRARFMRVEELVAKAADIVPGLVPSEAQLAAERGRLQGEKDGLEIDQGIFLSHVLGDAVSGRHLCHAMLLPRPDSEEHRARLSRDGMVDLGAAAVVRRGASIEVSMRNPRALNAEDQTTIDATEIAIDLATLDPASSIGVLRGGAVQHPKYRDRRILGSGINLTRLYRGEIPYLWFPKRDLGWVHKLFRGVATPEILPDDVHGSGVEKPWIAAVETFAIGGHCQALLATDFVIAERDAFMTLPARKEGIVPGAANLRLARFVGDRLARQAVQYERRLECDSPEGRLICDEVVEAGASMDAAIATVVAGLTSSGAVGAVSNRRAFRVAMEPLDRFREYMAVYAREQAYCHFSPALIANLERHWNAQSRRT